MAVGQREAENKQSVGRVNTRLTSDHCGAMQCIYFAMYPDCSAAWIRNSALDCSVNHLSMAGVMVKGTVPSTQNHLVIVSSATPPPLP